MAVRKNIIDHAPTLRFNSMANCWEFVTRGEHDGDHIVLRVFTGGEETFEYWRSNDIGDDVQFVSEQGFKDEYNRILKDQDIVTADEWAGTVEIGEYENVRIARELQTRYEAMVALNLFKLEYCG